MFSRFFIDRPIFAVVLSILIALAGTLAIFNLPLSQYPPVTPPTVQVNCVYPGASAQVVAQTVATAIEQEVNGVEKMLYMQSQCTNDGAYNLAVTFEQGVNLNLAQVLVQNRVNLALPKLPDVLKKTGVTTRKMSPDILMSINFNSPDGRYDQLYLSNFALTRVRDEILRVDGVGDVFIIGQRDYSMRIWVDPDKMASRGLTAGDVVTSLREQNTEVACGFFGQQPSAPGQETQIKLSTRGRLKTPEEFAEVILRVTPQGRVTRLKDVARVVLGSKSEDINCKLDGKQSVGLLAFQLPDANALDVAARLHAKLKELSKTFPEGISYETQYDTTPYTRQCIAEVVKALRDATILVAFVVLLFLQNWRSAIIPLAAVPVAIIGTFAVMFMLGFSLNNLTLFGLVLAIGIVVDDAIVVVEAVEHNIEKGAMPREATMEAMRHVSGPVIAVGLVLSAVFIPCAFISGVTGQFFRQFALTIAASTIISTFNSLTLSPALAALFLRPRDRETHEPLPRAAFALLGGWLAYTMLVARSTDWLATQLGPNAPALPTLALALPWIAAACGALAGWFAGIPAIAALRWAFGLFNRGFNKATDIYARAVRRLLRASALVLLVYAGLLVLTWWEFTITPKGFVPMQDMGYVLVNVQLPDAASAERTREITRQVQTICSEMPGVQHTLAVAGMSFFNNATSSIFGSMFVILDDFSKREAPGCSAEDIANKLRVECAKRIPDARVDVLPPPPLRGVGRTGGFKFIVEQLGDADLPALEQAINRLVEVGNKTKAPGDKPLLVALSTVFRANAPQLFVDLDRRECMVLGVPLGSAFNTLQIYLGSLYVNNFNLFGRTWQVVVQADAQYRDKIADVKRLKVRNPSGTMVPIGTLATVREINGPLMFTRYNMRTAGGITGGGAQGISSRQAIEAMQQVAKAELPRTMQYEWTEMAFLELQSGNTAMLIFGLAVVTVFLVLAAQYESWSLPLAVILVVPMCLLSAIIGVGAIPACLPKSIVGLNPSTDINIFTQVGFVVLVGLASKNAILIVEFAKRRREEGASRHEAALDACRLRLRPIVMTSFAFILGVFPLLIARGAGSEMRRTLGTAVFSGMLGVTFFGLILTPVFFNVVDAASGARFFQSRTWHWFRYITLGRFIMEPLLARQSRDCKLQNEELTPDP